jgi:hypothetical protein
MISSDFKHELLLTTVPLWSEWKGQTYAASGVFLTLSGTDDAPADPTPILVTAAEVVSGCDRLFVGFGHPARNRTSSDFLRAELPGNALTPFVDSSREVAAIPGGAIIAQIESVGKAAVRYRSVSEDLVPAPLAWHAFSPFENVIAIGHPEFLPFTLARVPVAQRGITATSLADDFNYTPSFLIDISSVPGLTGSAVFIERALPRGVPSGRLEFVGIVVDGMQTTGIGVTLFSRVIKSTAVFEAARMMANRARAVGTSPNA